MKEPLSYFWVAHQVALLPTYAGAYYGNSDIVLVVALMRFCSRMFPFIFKYAANASILMTKKCFFQYSWGFFPFGAIIEADFMIS